MKDNRARIGELTYYSGIDDLTEMSEQDRIAWFERRFAYGSADGAKRGARAAAVQVGLDTGEPGPENLAEDGGQWRRI